MIKLKGEFACIFPSPLGGESAGAAMISGAGEAPHQSRTRFSECKASNPPAELKDGRVSLAI
jgi:hypothetical protein